MPLFTLKKLFEILPECSAAEAAAFERDDVGLGEVEFDGESNIVELASELTSSIVEIPRNRHGGD